MGLRTPASGLRFSPMRSCWLQQFSSLGFRVVGFLSLRELWDSGFEHCWFGAPLVFSCVDGNLGDGGQREQCPRQPRAILRVDSQGAEAAQEAQGHLRKG